MAATMVAPLSLNEGMSLSLEPDKILFDEFAVKEASILPAVPKPDLLVTSPYTELPHLLDLSTLDTPNQLLARALVDLKFIREDHRTAPYIDSFNWTEIFDSVRRLARESNFKWNETEFYIVVFRSQIPPTTEYSHLGALDKDAHAEAVASGGFLKYKFSTPDAEGRNIATCLWRTQNDARVGSLGVLHRKAARAAYTLYTGFTIERYRLMIHEDAKSWEMIPLPLIIH